MADDQGSFIWYELLTTDPDSAAAFYGSVIGWRSADSGVPGVDYRLFLAAERGVAGMMMLPSEARSTGARPGWIGYVHVRDVDAEAAAFEAARGRVHKAPADIPGVGRFAVLSDPQGAVVAVLRPDSADDPVPPSGAPGHGAWRELLASDWPSAFGFYAERFGWTKDESVDMGPMGTYQLVAHDGQAFGGMMTKPPSVPAPSWVYYFAVESVDAAAGRVTAAGGQVINGPHEVPGGSWIVQCLDPQGAMFALNGPR